MEVHVTGEPRARRAAEVPAEVVALGRIDVPEGGDARGSEPMDLERLAFRQRRKVADMAVRGDEQVARRVREPVEDDDRLLAARDDELAVARGRAAKKAALVLVGGLDVLEPPRRPQVLHDAASTRTTKGAVSRALRPCQMLLVSSRSRKPG